MEPNEFISLSQVRENMACLDFTDRELKNWRRHRLIKHAELRPLSGLGGSVSMYGPDTLQRIPQIKEFMSQRRDANEVRLRLWLFGFEFEPDEVKRTIRRSCLPLRLVMRAVKSLADVFRVLDPIWRPIKSMSFVKLIRRRVGPSQDQERVIASLFAIVGGVPLKLQEVPELGSQRSLEQLLQLVLEGMRLKLGDTELRMPEGSKFSESLEFLVAEKPFAFQTFDQILRELTVRQLEAWRDLFNRVFKNWDRIEQILLESDNAIIVSLAPELRPVPKRSYAMLLYAILTLTMALKEPTPSADAVVN